MFNLSEDHAQIRDLARDFARNEIAPGAASRDESGEFPMAIAKQLGEMGFMGMFVPEEYGGAGMDLFAYVLALEEICYADASVGVTMSVQNSLCISPILNFASEAQKQRYLPSLCSFEKIGCYALTEPNTGSDAGSQKTKYVVDANGDYVLNGSKMFITNGPHADICVSYANRDIALRHRGVSAFIIERAFSGYSVGNHEKKMGIRSSSTSELVFEDLLVPKENLLHSVDQGFTVAMATLDGGRIGIAAQALGIAQRALDLSVSYAKQREQFGKAISNFQAIQWKIADMRTRIEAARLLTWRAAWLKGQGDARGSAECSMAKLMASEVANFCAYEAVQIHGGYGYSREYEVERLYRDARITTIYEGTSEVQRMVIARDCLK